MLHFGVPLTGHTSVWGARVLESSEADWPHALEVLNARIPRPMAGQFRGGVGMFRTTTGQPQVLSINGAYALNVYTTTYSYINGSYSLAIEVALALTDGITVAGVEAPTANYQLSVTDGLTCAPVIVPTPLFGLSLTDGVSIAD